MARRARKRWPLDDALAVELRPAEPAWPPAEELRSQTVAAMRESRMKPRRITADKLIPPEVHQHYEQRWGLEDAALFAAEQSTNRYRPLLAQWLQAWPTMIGVALFGVVLFCLLVH